MPWQIRDTYLKVWEVDEHENYSVVSGSTSRKDKQTDEYVSSNWKFIRFVGDAHQDIKNGELKEKDRIKVIAAIISHEPYIKDGERVWPKYPQITVFKWEHPESDDRRYEQAPVVTDDEPDDIPF